MRTKSKKIEEPKRGGRREGVGRPTEGKARYTVTLTEDAVKRAKKLEPNFSGLLDRLLGEWVQGEKNTRRS